MPVFNDFKMLSKSASLHVSVHQAPDFPTENTVLILRNDVVGGASSVAVTLTKQEALEFAESLDTLKSFIIGAYGLMDSYAEAFERSARMSDALGMTDPE